MEETRETEAVIPTVKEDYVIRAMACDGQIRAFAAVTRGLVEEARRRHDTSPVVTAALGRLLTAGALIGSQMKGEEDTLTLKIRGDGPVQSLTAVADSHGHVKGYAAQPQAMRPVNAKGKLDVAGVIGKGQLTVIRDLGLKEPYVGSIELVSGEIAEDLTQYYAVSEQTPTAVSLGVLMDRGNTVAQAGGFLLQLMPGVTGEAAEALEQTILAMPPITALLGAGKAPEEILTDLLQGFDPEFTEKQPVAFCCDCSREKAARALSTLEPWDLLDLMAAQKTVRVHCDYCNTDYGFDRPELKAIYKKLKEEKGRKKHGEENGPQS